MNVSARTIVLTGLAIPVAYLSWKALRASQAVAGTVEELAGSLGNWTDRRAQDANIFYSATNAALEVVTLEPGTTLGGLVFELLHPNEPDLEAPT